MCHTLSELAPWFAINFGQENMVSVESVVLFNRNEGGPKFWERTHNVDVRLANELPSTAEKMFTEGVLLKSYKGPARRGERVELLSSLGWEQKRGRYLIVQIDMASKKQPLNLKEVFVYGVPHLHTKGI